MSIKLDINIRIDYNAKSWATEEPSLTRLKLGISGQTRPKTRREARCYRNLAPKNPIVLWAIRED